MIPDAVYSVLKYSAGRGCQRTNGHIHNLAETVCFLHSVRARKTTQRLSKLASDASRAVLAQPGCTQTLQVCEMGPSDIDSLAGWILLRSIASLPPSVHVDGRVHTNGMENFWSLLKRGLNGTYVAVEPFHLFRYVDEQAFRYNNRKDEKGNKLSDGERFKQALSQIVGKRLTFAEVTGKEGEKSF